MVTLAGLQVFCSAFDVVLDKRAWIAILIIPIIITNTAIRELNQIAPFSLVASVLIVYGIIVILYAGISSMT